MGAEYEAQTAPECPWWCTEDHGDEWERGGGGRSKVCRRQVLAADDVDGLPVELELARFASVIDGQVLVAAATVARTRAGASIDLEAARSIAATLNRLAEMVQEPARVA